MTTASNPYELLTQAANLINERGQTHGGVEDSFQLIADLFSLRIGRDFHPYEVCIVLECVKEARMFANPINVDNYLDGINYRAFAALFASDYLRSKAGSSPDISYKRKANFSQAEMKPVKVEAKGAALKLPQKHSSSKYPAALEELDEELNQKNG